MQISGNFCCAFERASPCHFIKLIIPWKNMFSRENISWELTFANWVAKIANFTKVISGIQIRNLISQKRRYFSDLRPKG